VNLTELLVEGATGKAAVREGMEVPDVVEDWAVPVAEGVGSRAWDRLGAISMCGSVAL
jgi:hypothetical protein